MINPILKTRFQRRLNLATSKAVIGDANGVVYDDPINRKGYYRVRRRTAAGLSTYFVARASGTLQMELYPGAPVILGWEDDEEVILKPDVKGQIAAGYDPNQNNAANRPLNKWLDTSNIGQLSSTPTSPESLYVVVNSLVYLVGDTFYHYYASEDNNGTPKGKVNLTSYIPTAGNHRLAGLFLTQNNEIAVGASTTQTMDIPVDLSDLQECRDNSPADSIPVAFWYVHDAQTTITQADYFMDGKQIINIPFGFRNNLNKALGIEDEILKAQIFDLDPMQMSDPLAIEIFS